MVDGQWVIDSSAVISCWQHPYYPRYLIPLTDIRAEAMPEGALQTVDHPGPDHRLVGWKLMDHWFEEDEEVFVHPRSPYTRVDAVRSSRRVRVAHDGVTVADAAGCVIVFETGLPPRYYLDKTAIDWSQLTSSDTVTACPYKGTTSQYWNCLLYTSPSPRDS